jgi:hypothetical protein
MTWRKIKTPYNTDGSINKLVMVFAGDSNASPSKTASGYEPERFSSF